MTKQEQLVASYFHSWLTKDASVLKETFAEDAVYTESWGPVYYGLSQIEQWFCDWHKQGTVLKWEIKEFLSDGNRTICSWYFECNYMGEISGFDGVSWIVFNDEGKISTLDEYQSKLPHHTPYEPTKGE